MHQKQPLIAGGVILEEKTYNSKDVEEWIELAGQASQEGDTEKAREYLLNAVKADSENAQTWSALSVFAKSRDEAIQALEKVLELQPGYKGAAERLELLEKMLD